MNQHPVISCGETKSKWLGLDLHAMAPQYSARFRGSTFSGSDSECPSTPDGDGASYGPGDAPTQAHYARRLAGLGAEKAAGAAAVAGVPPFLLWKSTILEYLVSCTSSSLDCE